MSQLPALLGRAQRPARTAVVHHSADGFYSIRQGKWKLEFCYGSGRVEPTQGTGSGEAGAARVQLYDLAADIGEKVNVQDKYPEVVKRLTRLMEKYVAEGRSTPGPRRTTRG